MANRESKYPQCEKLNDSYVAKTAILDFLSWLRAIKQADLCTMDAEGKYRYMPVSEENLIMEYLDINIKELEEERCRMVMDLNNISSNNKETT